MEINHVHDHLQVSLRLHPAAHDAHGRNRLVTLGDEGRDDRVIRAFAAFVSIGMLFIEAEVLSTVIERNTGARNYDTGAEAAEVTLNHAHHVAFGISRGKVNRGAVARIAHFRHDRRIGFDEFSAVIGVLLA